MRTTMRKQFMRLLGVLAAGAGIVLLGPARPAQLAAAGDVTISVPTSFVDLDGSGLDADGVVNGVFTVTGNLSFIATGTIHCNDNATDQPPGPVANGASACPIQLVVGGNM